MENNNLIDLSEIIGDIINLGIIDKGLYNSNKKPPKMKNADKEVKNIVEEILLENERSKNINNINNNFNYEYNNYYIPSVNNGQLSTYDYENSLTNNVNLYSNKNI